MKVPGKRPRSMGISFFIASRLATFHDGCDALASRLVLEGCMNLAEGWGAWEKRRDR